MTFKGAFMQRKILSTISPDVQLHALSFLSARDQHSTSLVCKSLRAEAKKSPKYPLFKQVEEYKTQIGSYPAFEEDLADQIKMEELLVSAREFPGDFRPIIDGVKALLEKHKDKKWILYYKGLMYIDEYSHLGLVNFKHEDDRRELAVMYLMQAAKAGDHKAANQLCYLIHISESTTEAGPIHYFVAHSERPQLFPILENALKEKCYLDALTGLAFAYLHQVGVEIDFAQAEHYAKRALLENADDTAVLGAARCCVTASYLYSGFPPLPDATQYLERMFDLKPTALMAIFLAESADEARLARKWYLLAYTLGSAEAAANIGNFYEEGRGVAKNLKKALRWYQRAVARDYVEAIEDVERCEENLAAKSVAPSGLRLGS